MPVVAVSGTDGQRLWTAWSPETTGHQLRVVSAQPRQDGFPGPGSLVDGLSPHDDSADAGRTGGVSGRFRSRRNDRSARVRAHLGRSSGHAAVCSVRPHRSNAMVCGDANAARFGSPLARHSRSGRRLSGRGHLGGGERSRLSRVTPVQHPPHCSNWLSCRAAAGA